MTGAYSVAFKRKMVERLTGKNAISANQLAMETGVRQQNPAHWLREASAESELMRMPRSRRATVAG
jgi:hypothetical protein